VRLLHKKDLTEDSSLQQLNHLLDLKQKQGNLVIVRDTRSLASEAEQRAKDSAWQSKLLFIFTIITVIFVSFPTIPIILQAFPHIHFRRLYRSHPRFWQSRLWSFLVQMGRTWLGDGGKSLSPVVS
jgi:hypothetical protein